MGFREALRQMRADVHGEFARAALYIESPGADPVPCTVRVHGDNAMHGGLQGTNFHYAEREDFDAKLRFDVSEITSPVRGAIVTFSETEGFRIDRRQHTDGTYVYCPATILDAEDMAGLPYPGQI